MKENDKNKYIARIKKLMERDGLDWDEALDSEYEASDMSDKDYEELTALGKQGKFNSDKKENTVGKTYRHNDLYGNSAEKFNRGRSKYSSKITSQELAEKIVDEKGGINITEGVCISIAKRRGYTEEDGRAAWKLIEKESEDLY